MKKYLSIIVGLMALGAFTAFAANDLTLQTSVQVSAGTIYTVTGDYIMDSITVNADNFTVTLSPGGSLTVTAPGGTPISATHSNGIMTDKVCSSAESRMQLVARSTAGAETVTISTGGICGGSSGGTPNATTTVTVAPTITTTTVAPTTTTTTTSAATTPAVTTSVATTVTTPAVTISAVTTSAATTPAVAVVSAWEFRTPLKLGSTETAVTELQKRLTSEGVYSGPITGYFGSLTLAAVKKYQEEQGIATAGQAGYGNVGPATRAKLNSTAATTSVAVASTTQASSATIEALQTQLQALQAQLLMLLSQQLQLLQAGQ